MPTRSQYGKQEMRPDSNPESSDPGMELNLQGLDMNSPVEFRTFVVFFFLVIIFLQRPIVFAYDALRSSTLGSTNNWLTYSCYLAFAHYHFYPCRITCPYYKRA